MLCIDSKMTCIKISYRGINIGHFFDNLYNGKVRWLNISVLTLKNRCRNSTKLVQRLYNAVQRCTTEAILD